MKTQGSCLFNSSKKGGQKKRGTDHVLAFKENVVCPPFSDRLTLIFRPFYIGG